MEKEETNGQINKPKGWIRKPKRINVTTSVDDQIWEKGKRNKIAWSEALEFGINFCMQIKMVLIILLQIKR